MRRLSSTARCLAGVSLTLLGAHAEDVVVVVAFDVAAEDALDGSRLKLDPRVRPSLRRRGDPSERACCCCLRVGLWLTSRFRPPAPLLLLPALPWDLSITIPLKRGSAETVFLWPPPPPPCIRAEFLVGLFLP